MTRDTHADPDTENRSTTIDRAITRRGALGALGATLLSTSAGADGHCDDGGWSWFGGFFDDDCDDENGDDPDDETGGGIGDGSDGDAEVRRDGSTWIADNGGSTVHTGGDMLDAIQAAVDSLTPGRTSEETVVVHDSGTVGPHSWDGDLKTVDLRSNTILDVRGAITVEDTGDPLVVPVRGLDVDSVEVPNLTVEGNPRFGMRIESCSNVTLGDIEMHLSDGLGIRIDDNFAGRTVGVELDSAYVTGSGTHAVETYGVDDVDIGRVETRDTGGCGLLLNDTSDATVGTVDATRADQGGGYAAFRVANGAGPNIRVEEVISVDSGRGVFGVPGSHGFTVERVDVEGSEQGILIQDCQHASVEGGSVRNSAGEGVRIDSRDGGDHPPASAVTVTNLRVVDDRWFPQQTYGIRETGPGTNRNYILDNDVRGGGTVAEIEVSADDTVVSGTVTS